MNLTCLFWREGSRRPVARESIPAICFYELMMEYVFPVVGQKFPVRGSR